LEVWCEALVNLGKQKKNEKIGRLNHKKNRSPQKINRKIRTKESIKKIFGLFKNEKKM